jgi:hypothetical protein
MITKIIAAERATDIFNSVPTCFSSSGEYWAAGALPTGALLTGDFTDEITGFTAAAASVPVVVVTVAAGAGAVLPDLLEANLICLRLDLPGMLVLFS